MVQTPQVPGLITSKGPAQGIAGAAVTVTPGTSGILTGPPGYAYGWVVVNNSSPFLMVCTGAEGQNTIQPYQADRMVPTGQGIAYSLINPPGGAPTAPNPYVQPDWYVAGAGPPPGVFPYPLTAAAINAAITAIALVGASRVSAPTPAAGADFTYTFAAIAPLLVVRATLTTSSGGAARSVELSLNDNGGNRVFDSQSPATQAPSTSFIYEWGMGLPLTQEALSGLTQINVAPVPAWINPGVGWAIFSTTNGIQPADQWSVVAVTHG